MGITVLAIRFIAELVGVSALAYVGWHVGPDGIGRFALAVAAPVSLIVVWAIIVAPNADNPLSQRAREAIGTVLLVGVGCALAAAGEPRLAAVYAAVVVIDWIAVTVLGPSVQEAMVASTTARR